jgi:hypothetical protein
MSFVETINAIRGKSAKYVGKLDMILDLVENVAVSAAGVPVTRDAEGQVIDSEAGVINLDAEQNELLVTLSNRVSALEARMPDNSGE